jgi:pimeloyl-ACP methyl ester carboxylesterase
VTLARVRDRAGTFTLVTDPIQDGATTVRGRRLAWRAVGSGPPLLLVNGYAATAADWDPAFVAALGASFRVVCPDHRGMGASSIGDPAEPLTVGSMAADLERVLDALGLESAPVVGWSMGGFVAQRLAVTAPSRVGMLVLLSTDPGGPDALLAAPDVWARLTDHTGTPREQATRLIALLFPPEVARTVDEQFGDAVAEARAALDVAVLTAQQRAMEAWHAQEQARPPGRTGLAVLAATGTRDVVIPPGNADRLAAHWPGCTVERFAGGGHAFMAQQPQRLADLIAAFASRVR